MTIINKQNIRIKPKTSDELLEEMVRGALRSIYEKEIKRISKMCDIEKELMELLKVNKL